MQMESGSFVYAQPKDSIDIEATPTATHAVRYRGTFKDNIPHGTGTLEFSNGDFYEGEFAAGVASVRFMSCVCHDPTDAAAWGDLRKEVTVTGLKSEL
jgi:hypothetical protein